MSERIIIKASRADLPLLRDRYPFIYLEHGRLEIDDSSVKWISAEREIFRIPAATISALLLGPGTSITHEAVKVLAEYLACIARQFLPRAHGGVSTLSRILADHGFSSPCTRGCFFVSKDNVDAVAFFPVTTGCFLRRIYPQCPR